MRQNLGLHPGQSGHQAVVRGLFEQEEAAWNSERCCANEIEIVLQLARGFLRLLVLHSYVFFDAFIFLSC